MAQQLHMLFHIASKVYPNGAVIWSNEVELLGMTYAVLECASCIRGTHFIVECDHQALKPLYQDKHKGTIYERCLVILQEFNFDFFCKQAKEMSIPDALSRDLPGNSDTNFDSPDQKDIFFPYIKEESGNIYFQGGQRLTQGMLNTCPKEINHLRVSSKPIQDNGYDALTNPLLPSLRNSVGRLYVYHCRGNLLLGFIQG